MTKFVVNLEYDVSDERLELISGDQDESKRVISKWFLDSVRDIERYFKLKSFNGFIGFLPEDDNDKKD